MADLFVLTIRTASTATAGATHFTLCEVFHSAADFGTGPGVVTHTVADRLFLP